MPSSGSAGNFKPKEVVLGPTIVSGGSIKSGSAKSVTHCSLNNIGSLFPALFSAQIVAV